MAAVSTKGKKSQQKPPKSRPIATSGPSLSSVEDHWSTSLFSSFSPSNDFFAIVSLSVDKHRLRVINVASHHVVSEFVLDDVRVTSLSWVFLDLPDNSTPSEEGPSKKRKKATDITRPSDDVEKLHLTVALGSNAGSVHFFSPTQGRVVQILKNPASQSSSILAVASDFCTGSSRKLWTSSEDGTVRLWTMQKGEVISSWQGPGKASLSAIASRPGFDGKDEIQVLVGGLTIHLLSFQESTIKELHSFTGHASSVKQLSWDPSSSCPTRFFSYAADDRFVYVWDVPESGSRKTKATASCPLDTDVIQIHTSFCSGRTLLAALSSSGKILVSPVPLQLLSTPSKSSKQQIPTLIPKSSVRLLAQKNTHSPRILAVALSDASLNLALLNGGTRLSFEKARFLDENGDFNADVSINASAPIFDLLNEATVNGAIEKRYSEANGVMVSTGSLAEHGVSTPNGPLDQQIDGTLDIDLAEMSLGQRLAARGGTDVALRPSGSEQEVDAAQAPNVKGRKKKGNPVVVPANSLSRTLIQALHSSDNGLLEACLAHSDEILVRNSVQRLPPQLAVPLLNACVERLGRGNRGNNMKGRGGGSSAQRGMSLIVWVKATLTVHGGHLLTMPDLVAKLSHLHSTLTSRLTLQERLLSLSGRLDLALAQVELRSSDAPAPLAPKKSKRGKKAVKTREAALYIEGESSEDEEHMDVPLEEEDETGSIEDIELGADSELGDSEVSDDDDDDEEDDEDGGDMNGFIDDEAEEDEDEDDEDESEQDSD